MITAATPRKSGCRSWSANTSSTPTPTSLALLARARHAPRGADLPAFLSLLLALENADHLSRGRAVLHPHRRTARESARRDQESELDSRLGRKSHRRHGGIAARLGHLAPAQLGRAAAGFLFRRRRGDSRTRNGFASWPISSRSAARTSGSSSTTPRSRASSACRKARRHRNDTIDVWIDSAASRTRRFCATHPELRDPADMYLEATDQHRGWFQSSLMTSVALHDRAPYKTCVTHGFVVDVDGKKISKSSTYNKPMDAGHFVGRHGADLVRLWVSSINYTDDVPFSEEMFTRLGDTYRRIRNTLRILLGNLHDFESARAGKQDSTEFTLVDRWILDRLAAGDRGMPRGLCGLRIPQGLSHAQSILRGRPEQPLHRYHQGPDVLRRAGFAAPPRHAGGDAARSSTRFASCSRRSSSSPPRKRGVISAATARFTCNCFPSRKPTARSGRSGANRGTAQVARRHRPG